MNNGAIAWAAKKVRIVPDSTAEAETAVASRAAKDTVAVRMILGDMRAEVHGPTPLLGDCRATRDIITKPGSSQRTRYFERTTMFVKRLFMIGVISPLLIRTDDMIVDALTKPVDRSRLGKFRNRMLNQDHGPGTMGASSADARRLTPVEAFVSASLISRVTQQARLTTKRVPKRYL